MPEKRDFEGRNAVGDISSVNTVSTKLNNQPNLGGVKPVMTGEDNPGNTKPPRAPEQKVAMPK